MSNNSNILFKELSNTIIGIAMRVHTKLGAGLPECCYSRAVALEFDSCNIPYSREFKVIVNYNDTAVGHLIPDIVVDSKIILSSRRIAVTCSAPHRTVLANFPHTALH
jgi:GxxExxY protein